MIIQDSLVLFKSASSGSCGVMVVVIPLLIYRYVPYFLRTPILHPTIILSFDFSDDSQLS